MKIFNKSVHLLIPFAIPKMLRKRCRLNPFLFYDLSTIALGVLSFLNSFFGMKQAQRSFPIAKKRQRLLMGIFAGTSFFYFSDLAFSKLNKKGKIKEIKFKKSIPLDLLLVPTAISEELIWHSDFCSADEILNILGFGIMHRPLGGIPSVIQMFLFRFLLDALNAKAGFSAATLGHVSYNLLNKYVSISRK